MTPRSVVIRSMSCGDVTSNAGFLSVIFDDLSISLSSKTYDGPRSGISLNYPNIFSNQLIESLSDSTTSWKSVISPNVTPALLHSSASLEPLMAKAKSAALVAG